MFCSPQPICLDYVNLKISRYAHHFGVLCRAALKLKGRSCRTAGVGGPCENMVPPKQKCLFITLQPPSSIYIYKISIYIYTVHKYIIISWYIDHKTHYWVFFFTNFAFTTWQHLAPGCLSSIDDLGLPPWGNLHVFSYKYF